MRQYQTLRKDRAKHDANGNIVPKTKGSPWQDCSYEQASVMIANRYGSSAVNWVFAQIETGHAADCGWGYLRLKPGT